MVGKPQRQEQRGLHMALRSTKSPGKPPFWGVLGVLVPLKDVRGMPSWLFGFQGRLELLWSRCWTQC